ERVLRKRETETDSDSDYVEKSKKRKKGRRNEYHDSGLREQQIPTISNNYSEVEPAQQTALTNKPIVTKMMYDEYFPYLICAFNSTINYIKETIKKETYVEIKKMLQMNDRLILQESVVKKLETIFETDYSEIESKIIEETVVEANDQSESSRFTFFIRYTLLDFVTNFKYITPRVLDCDMSERTFIVECLAPIFRSFRNAFPDNKIWWIEKDATSIKVANKMFEDDIGSRKVDILIQRLTDNKEILNTEVSGPPFKSALPHTVGDTKKLLMMSVCSLCQLFSDNLDCGTEDAKRIRTYSIQVIGNRLTLFAVSLTDRKKYLALEMATCLIPFSFDTISHFTKIFNFFRIIRTEFKEQNQLRKKISNLADNINTRVRDWLYFPDDSFFYNLKIIPEDIDKVVI
ncbi:6581_t:CDS:2, partial [Funneliformis geosporum]